MDVRIEETWKEALAAEWEKPYFRQLTEFVRREYATTAVFPPAGKIFAAFDACPFDKVKVVLLGQDRPRPVGGAGGVPPQRHTDGSVPRRRFAPAPGMGDFHRCGNRDPVGQARQPRVPSVGKLRHIQGKADRPAEAPRAHVAPPLPAVCPQRLLRQQPFFKS